MPAKKNGRSEHEKSGGIAREADERSSDSLLGNEVIDSARKAFRQKEQAIFAQQEVAEQRALVMEYEQYRDETARLLFEELADSTRANLRKEKIETFSTAGVATRSWM